MELQVLGRPSPQYGKVRGAEQLELEERDEVTAATIEVVTGSGGELECGDRPDAG